MIEGKKAQYFSWSHFIKNFSDVENFGRIFFNPPQEPKNLLNNSDFNAKITGNRFLGKWFAVKVIHKDTAVFRTEGASTRLDDENPMVGQYLVGTHGNTQYKLSFYLKTQEISGGSVRAVVRFGTRQVFSFPTIPFTGTMPWTRFEYDFTSPAGEPAPDEKIYIRLIRSEKATGTAWFDQVEITEAQ